MAAAPYGPPMGFPPPGFMAPMRGTPIPYGNVPPPPVSRHEAELTARLSAMEKRMEEMQALIDGQVGSQGRRP